MFNSEQEIQFAQERRQKLLHEARMHQLFRNAECDRTQTGKRLLALLGDLMISSGSKLKARSGVRGYSIEPQKT